MIGQYLFLFSMSAKPSDLDNVVDYPFRRANIWVQLKTWDAQAMKDVIRRGGRLQEDQSHAHGNEAFRHRIFQPCVEP